MSSPTLCSDNRFGRTEAGNREREFKVNSITPLQSATLIILWFLSLLASSVNARTLEPVPESMIYCTVCHGTMLQGNRSTEAPGIAGLPKWYTKNQLLAFALGWRGQHADDLAGAEMYPVAVELEQSDFERIAEKVSALPAPAATGQLDSVSIDELERGRRAFSQCSACHGTRAEGNEQLNAPPLTVQGTWYIEKQVANFKSGIRGFHSNDQAGKLMAASVATINEEDITALARYIGTLK